jgi:deoxyribonuclease V
MNSKLQHDWNVTPAEARAIQERLRHEVIAEDKLGTVRLVAGVDVGFEENGTVSRAAVAVLSLADLSVVATAVSHLPTNFPYIPGYLSFREVPAILEALAQLQTLPDLLLCDGMGLAHPRRLGLACHLGVLTGIPAIGVGKTRFIGRYELVGHEKGSWQPLWDAGEIVGAVLRTRTAVKPVYVSVGHKVSLATAVSYTLQCTPQYRLPETTRQAHRLASRL